jgi:hypothetical protein
MKVLLFMALIGYIFGADLDKLQQEKNEYKQSLKYQKNFKRQQNIANKVIVVFNNKLLKEELQKFSKDYNLTYNLCLTNTICIFKIKDSSVISKIKQNQNIADIMEYKKHTFKEY